MTSHPPAASSGTGAAPARTQSTEGDGAAGRTTGHRGKPSPSLLVWKSLQQSLSSSKEKRKNILKAIEEVRKLQLLAPVVSLVSQTAAPAQAAESTSPSVALL